MELLPLVLSAPMRAPGLLAAIAATLQEITPGRVRVGLGAGVDAREHLEAGATFGSPRERVDAVEATVKAIRGRSTIHLPIVIAGAGPRMMGIAARHADEWNCGMMEAGRRKELLAALDRACEKAQRTVRRSALVTVLGGEPPSGDLARRYNWHLAFRGTSTSQLVDEIGELLSLGLDALYLSSLSPAGWESILGALQVLGSKAQGTPT